MMLAKKIWMLIYGHVRIRIPQRNARIHVVNVIKDQNLVRTRMMLAKKIWMLIYGHVRIRIPQRNARIHVVNVIKDQNLVKMRTRNVEKWLKRENGYVMME